MTSRGQCPRGGACECPRVGAFFKLMTSRGQCPRGGGCAWCSTHPSSDPPPPHLAGWLATGLLSPIFKLAGEVQRHLNSGFQKPHPRSARNSHVGWFHRLFYEFALVCTRHRAEIACSINSSLLTRTCIDLSFSTDVSQRAINNHGKQCCMGVVNGDRHGVALVQRLPPSRVEAYYVSTRGPLVATHIDLCLREYTGSPGRNWVC